MAAVRKTDELQSLKRLVPLNALPNAKFAELVEKLVIERLPKGKLLFRQGDKERVAVYLLSGKVQLLSGNREVNLIAAGSETARYPLGNQFPRQFSARTATPITFARIDNMLLNSLITADSADSYQVNELDSESGGDWMTRLVKSPVFQRTPASVIQQIIMRLEKIQVSKGQVVMEQGGPGDHYFIIEKGYCAISQRAAGAASETKIAELFNGDSFGEEALLTGNNRTTTATMLSDGVLLRMTRDDFIELVKKPALQSVAYPEARSLVESGGVWLDVRSPDDYQSVHLPDSLNLPFFIDQLRDAVLDRERQYVAVCDDGRISSTAAFMLLKSGHKVAVLDGGISTVPRSELVDEHGRPPQDQAAGKQATDGNSREATSSQARPPVDGKTDPEVLFRKITELEKELEHSRVSMVALDKEKKGKDTEIDRLKDEDRQIHEELSATSAQLHQAQEKIKALGQQQQNPKTRQASGSGDVQAYKEKLDKSEQQVRKLEDQTRRIQETLQQEREEQARQHARELADMQRQLAALRSGGGSESQGTAAELGELKARLQQSVAMQTEAGNEAKRVRNTLNKEQSQRQALETKLAKAIERESATSTELGNIRNDLASAQHELQELHTRSQRDRVKHDAELKNLHARMAEAEGAARQARDALVASQSERDGFETALRTAVERQTAAGMEAERRGEALERVKREFDEFRREQARQGNRLQAELVDARGRLERAESEVRTARDEARRRQETASTVGQEMAAVRAERESMESALRAATERQVSAEHEAERHMEALARTQAQMDALRSEAGQKEGRLQAELTELRARLEHAGSSANAAEAHARRGKNAEQSLQDLLAATRAEKDELELELRNATYRQAEAEESAQRASRETEALRRKASEFQHGDSHREQALKAELANLRGRLEEAEDVRRVAESRLVALEEDQRHGDKRSRDELVALKSELTRIRTRSVDAEARTRTLVGDLETAKVDNEQLRYEMDELKHVLIRNERENSELKEQLARSKTLAQHADSEKKKAEEKIAQRDHEVDTLRSVVEEYVEQIQAEQAVGEGGEIAALREELNVVRQQAEEDVQRLVLELKEARTGSQAVQRKAKKKPAPAPTPPVMPPPVLHDAEDSPAWKPIQLDTDEAEPTRSPGRFRRVAKISIILLVFCLLGWVVVSFTPLKEQFEQFAGTDVPDKVISGIFSLSSLIADSTRQNKTGQSKVSAKPAGKPKQSATARRSAKSPRNSVRTSKTVNAKGAPERAGTVKGAPGPIVKTAPKPARFAEQPGNATSVRATAAEEVGPRMPARNQGGRHPTIRDELVLGGLGPEMVAVEKPGSRQRKFAIGRHVVTFAEYDLFAEVSGRSLPDDRGNGRGERPVINVSWDDAVAYAAWLSRQTGKTYRLPRALELEFATANGVALAASSEQDPDELLGGSIRVPQSTPVMEWLQNCHQSGGNRVADDADCGRRLVSGGLKNSSMGPAVNTSRVDFAPDARFHMLGFRLVREL